MYCGGSFQAMSGMNYGNNLMSFEQTGTAVTDFQITPILNTDSTISCLAAVGNQLYFGGKFETNNFADTLNHIGYINVTLTGLTDAKVNSKQISIFPNPTQNYIAVNGLKSKTNNLQIINAIGDECLTLTNYQSGNNIDISKLQKGIYFVRCQDNETFTGKFVKN
jgi:hypothetical protein